MAVTTLFEDVFADVADARAEYERCKNSPDYFIEQYVGMAEGSHVHYEFEVFKLFPFQKAILRELGLHSKNAIFKPRQMGLTNLMLGYALWEMTFKETRNVLIVTFSELCASEMAKTFRDMYRRLPSFLKHELRTDNRLYCSFTNGSTITFCSSGYVNNHLGSITYHLVIFDEAAYISSIRSILPHVVDRVTGNPDVAIIAYSSGQSSKWKDVAEDFNKIPLHWSMHPFWNEEWKEEKIAQIGVEQFEKEYECI